MSDEMNARDMAAFKYFLAAHKNNWDLNQYYRTWYDQDLEIYRGYRNEIEYPMAYNLSFPKLLPRVFTVMSRFMDQLYQGGTDNLVSVGPRKKSDVDRAPRVQGLLNAQLESLNEIDNQGGSFLFNFNWMFNAITFGKGIAKLYWRREERIAPKRVYIPVPMYDNMGNLMGLDYKSIVTQDMQIFYDGPYAEVIHNKLFNPDPRYKSIQKMPFVSCIYKKSIDYCKKMADKGVYRNIDKLGWSGTQNSTGLSQDSAEAFAKSIEIEGAMQAEFDEVPEGKITPQLDIIEGWGRYIFPDDEAPYEVGSGYKIKGKESEAKVWIGNYKTILRLEKNKYGVRELFDIGAYFHPELYWDLGIIRLGRSLQQQVDNMGNLRTQNAMMLVNQMLKVREDAEIDPEALVPKPYGIIPVEQMDDIEPLVVPDIFSSGVFREQEQFFEDTISDITGMYPYSLGQTPQRQEYVGTIYSLQSMGEARTKLLMMTMDHQGFKPFLKYMMLLNMWHLPDETEARINGPHGVNFQPIWPQDLHLSYDFTARYTSMEPALGKNFRAQNLIQYAQMWAQSPYLQHYQFMKSILELMDFHDSDRYLKSPEQVNAEMMQQAQQAVQMQLLGSGLQNQLAAAADERQLQREVVKGIMKG